MFVHGPRRRAAWPHVVWTAVRVTADRLWWALRRGQFRHCSAGLRDPPPPRPPRCSRLGGWSGAACACRSRPRPCSRPGGQRGEARSPRRPPSLRDHRQSVRQDHRDRWPTPMARRPTPSRTRSRSRRDHGDSAQRGSARHPAPLLPPPVRLRPRLGLALLHDGHASLLVSGLDHRLGRGAPSSPVSATPSPASVREPLRRRRDSDDVALRAGAPLRGRRTGRRARPRGAGPSRAGAGRDRSTPCRPIYLALRAFIALAPGARSWRDPVGSVRCL